MKKLPLLILCALPLAGVVLWFFAGKNAGNLLIYGLILACPLSHVFLMKHHNHDPHNKHDQGKGGDEV